MKSLLKRITRMCFETQRKTHTKWNQTGMHKIFYPELDKWVLKKNLRKYIWMSKASKTICSIDHFRKYCFWKWFKRNSWSFFLFSEIGKVRGNLFQINGKKNEPLVLPDAVGTSTSLSEKVYVPIKEYPDVSLNTTQMYASRGVELILTPTPITHTYASIYIFCCYDDTLN